MLKEITELKQSIAENIELKELRSQIAELKYSTNTFRDWTEEEFSKTVKGTPAVCQYKSHSRFQAPGSIKTIEKRFDITTIKPEHLGFNFENCNNCGYNGCYLAIDYTVKEKDYRVEYQFTWNTENPSGRIVSYAMYNGDWRSIENLNLLYNGPVEKVLVKKASFDCSKPFNVKGSIPTGNCGHSGVAGCCSCGRHLNNVKELIQTAFDRILASS